PHHRDHHWSCHQRQLRVRRAGAVRHRRDEDLARGLRQLYLGPDPADRGQTVMPKTIGTGLKSHLAGEVTSLCTMWELTRRTDGRRYFFTDHDQDLSYGGNTYLAALGYTRTALQADSAMSVDNMNLAGLFDSDTLTVEDLRAGLLDHAEV